jgi:hypothetical protein
MRKCYKLEKGFKGKIRKTDGRKTRAGSIIIVYDHDLYSSVAGS